MEKLINEIREIEDMAVSLSKLGYNTSGTHDVINRSMMALENPTINSIVVAFTELSIRRKYLSSFLHREIFHAKECEE